MLLCLKCVHQIRKSYEHGENYFWNKFQPIKSDLSIPFTLPHSPVSLCFGCPRPGMPSIDLPNHTQLRSAFFLRHSDCHLSVPPLNSQHHSLERFAFLVNWFRCTQPRRQRLGLLSRCIPSDGPRIQSWTKDVQRICQTVGLQNSRETVQRYGWV